MSNTPSAHEIIERVKARYAGCRTYQDEAMITRTTIHGPRPWKPRVHRTQWLAAFVRPHLLRFEITELEPRVSRFAGATIIWTEDTVFDEARGDNSKARHSRPRTAQLESQARERSPFGCILLPLLLPLEGSDSRVFNCPAPFSSELVEFEGQVVYVLTSINESRTRRVYLDADSGALHRVETRDSRRVEDRMPEIERLQAELANPRIAEADRKRIQNQITDLDLVLDGVGTEETITFAPRIDHDIDPKVFEFVEPG